MEFNLVIGKSETNYKEYLLTTQELNGKVKYSMEYVMVEDSPATYSNEIDYITKEIEKSVENHRLIEYNDFLSNTPSFTPAELHKLRVAIKPVGVPYLSALEFHRVKNNMVYSYYLKANKNKPSYIHEVECAIAVFEIIIMSKIVGIENILMRGFKSK